MVTLPLKLEGYSVKGTKGLLNQTDSFFAEELLHIPVEHNYRHWTYHRLFYYAVEVWDQPVSWMYLH